MRTIELGRTGRQVSVIAFGAMQLGHTPEQGADEYDRRGRQAVLRALELGIDLFDTADVYGHGKSEEALARALKESGAARDRVVIATKCGILFRGMDPAYRYKAYDASAAYVKHSCEASLKRLGTDYVDLYQVHRIDYLSHPEETARALEDLRREGKVRWAGISNYTVGQVRALAAHGRVETLQTKFSLLHLEPIETDLAPLCQEMGMSLLAYSPLAAGLLSGKREFPHHNWLAQRGRGILAQLQPFAAEYGVTVAQLALAWLVEQPGVIPLVGTANPDHVAEAAGAAELRLKRDDWYELTVIARGRPMPYEQPPYVYLRER